MKKNKRFIAYGVLLFLSMVLAVWACYEPPYLAELKEMEPVESGTEEPLAAVNAALEAIGNKDERELFKLMLVKDSTEFQRYTAGLLAGPDFLPAKPVGCSRLIHSHRGDNISVFVQSQPRDKIFQFALQKDAAGAYKIRSISQTRQRP